MDNARTRKRKTSKAEIWEYINQVQGKLSNKHLRQMASLLPAYNKTFNREVQKSDSEGKPVSLGSYKVPVNHYRRLKQLYKTDGKEGIFRYLYKHAA